MAVEKMLPFQKEKIMPGGVSLIISLRSVFDNDLMAFSIFLDIFFLEFV